MAHILWFTGLSGSGKSTLAFGLAKKLKSKDFKVNVLDGDEVRDRLHKKLSFSIEDIKLNNQRIIEMCIMQKEAFDFIIVSLVSPFQELRCLAGRYFKPNFSEIYVRASLNTCMKRDVKGLYQKVLKGESAPLIGMEGGVAYEIPKNPELILHTDELRVEDCLNQLLSFLGVV